MEALKNLIGKKFLDRPAIFSSQFDMIAGLLSCWSIRLAAQRHMHKFAQQRDFS